MSLEGQQLGEFEILERIGQGGMGAVYKARQSKLRRLVALKTLQPSIADDADYIARFEQEAVAAAGLMHPNLVQVFSAGENDGLHWFAMEYVDGESAKTRLKRKGRLDPLEAIAITLHIATALEHGWRKAQLIHRDIKPDNIFLSSDGEVKLGDLGLAKSAGQTQGLTMTGHSMGTPHYISPEQVMSTKSVDFRADIYSLGCTLYHFLSGEVPFQGDTAVAIMMQHVNGPVPSLDEVWPECPHVLADMVGKMMQKQPGDRQQDYGDVISDLRGAYAVVSNQDEPTMLAESPKPQDEVEAVGTQPTPSPAASKSRAVVEGEFPLPHKSKRPLQVGVTVVVLALIGGGLFIHRPKKAQQSQDLPSAHEHATSPSPAVIESGAVKLWDSPEKIRSREGVEWRDGAVYLGNNKVLGDKSELSRDAIIRAEIKTNADARIPEIALRTAGSSSGGTEMLYGLDLDVRAQVIRLNSCIKGHFQELRHWPLPRQYGNEEWISIEFRAIGDDLTISVDGNVLGSVHDSTQPQAGGVRIYAYANGYFRNIVYTPLDRLQPVTLPTATKSADPSSASKDSPFVNNLGMKFVPVLILGGPTGGRRVLFSVWDTRVQDYEKFVKETKREWPKAEFEQGPTHPAVNVTWEDAQLFCQWLTGQEQAQGRIPVGSGYRLPSEHEWSCAVGIGAREDPAKSPSSKSQKVNDAFPWGTEWPPPKGAGNFAGEELLPALAAGKFSYFKGVIEGYNDGFVNTSPVDSFAANANGLYDMGGNVWQWCEDWFDNEQKDRVLRGASWGNRDRYSLLLSDRAHGPPGYRNYANGFRCVLELPAK